MEEKVNGDVGNKVKPAPKSRFASSLVPYHDDSILTDEEDEDTQEEEEASEKESSSSDDAEVAEAAPSAIVVDGVGEDKSALESDDEPQLPPEPQGRCSKELQDKINRLFMEMRGLDMNHIIQRRKEFRNPSIYEKLIQFCSINEFGTNYPPTVYDPSVWGKESFYDELNKAQRLDMEQKEKERKEKTKVQVLMGTAKKRAGGTGSGPEDEAPKRKSKWDQVGVATLLTQAQPQPINLLAASHQPKDLTSQPNNPRP